jgi:hypothetical protein
MRKLILYLNALFEEDASLAEYSLLVVVILAKFSPEDLILFCSVGSNLTLGKLRNLLPLIIIFHVVGCIGVALSVISLVYI